MPPKVVITGRGIITSLGAGLAASTDALETTKSGIAYAEDFHSNGLDSLVAGKINFEYDCPAFDRKALRFMPNSAKMAVYAAYEAITEAGFTMDSLPGDKMATVIGCSGCAYGEFNSQIRKFEENRNVRRVSPFNVPRFMPSAAVANISLLFKIKGESYDISCACTSSALAIMAGARLIKSGEYDIVLVGGAEEVSWEQAVGFNGMRALSHSYTDTPEKASRPFDRDRDGFVIAEGAGIVVLESEAHAKARGAKIICELKGYASNSNATDMVAPDRDSSAEVMRFALANAGLKPEEIDYINTHGTSTGVGDPIELDAIGDVFGRNGKVAMNSTKSQTGHLIGATSAVEAIFTSLMMEHSFISKSANLDNVIEGFEWADIVRETRYNNPIRYAISNSFGFGGTNATLVLGKYEG